MGVGDSLEAPYTLTGPIAAGPWHFIGDGELSQPIDERFDFVWRSAAGDLPIVSFTHHFDPSPAGSAVAYEADATGAAVPARPGDQLILRFTTLGGGTPTAYYEANGDGSFSQGRIPSVLLPPSP